MTTLALAGAIVWGCWAVALVNVLPPRAAVEHQQAGVKAYLAGDLSTVEREFRHVLDVRPDATSARLGMACVLWSRGRESGATIELVKAVQAGLPYPLRAVCGGGTDLSRFFQRRPVSTVLVILVPQSRVSSIEANRADAVLESDVPVDPPRADVARRLMAGACLAWRADYYGLGYEYAFLASSISGPRAQALPTFLRCIGKRRALIRCAPQAMRLAQCQFRRDIVRSQQRDQELGHL